MSDAPAAVQSLNYKGDVRGSIGRVMGPMHAPSLPEPQYLTVVEETYDSETDRTRLGLTYGIVDLTVEAT